MASAAESIEAFRELARRYSQAERQFNNSRATEASMDRRDDALSMKQAIEAEFLRCFNMISRPDWPAVEAAAAGEPRRAFG